MLPIKIRQSLRHLALRDLNIIASNGVVRVSCTTTSYYLRQLVDACVRHRLEREAGDFRYVSDVKVVYPSAC